MTTKAFQKIYTKIDNITKATVTVRAQGVGNDELATVGGKLAQVVRISGDDITLQVFQGTEGIATDAEVVFHGEPPVLKVSDELAGRFFDAYGNPLDGGMPGGGARHGEIGGPTGEPLQTYPALGTHRHRYRRYRPEQYDSFRAEDTFFRRPRPALQPGDGRCGAACAGR